MIFWGQSQCYFLLLQPNFSKTIELGKLFGIAKLTFGTFAQITKDDLICQHLDILTFMYFFGDLIQVLAMAGGKYVNGHLCGY